MIELSKILQGIMFFVSALFSFFAIGNIMLWFMGSRNLNFEELIFLVLASIISHNLFGNPDVFKVPSK